MIRAMTLVGLAALSAGMLFVGVPAAEAQLYPYPTQPPPVPIRVHRVEYRTLVWKDRAFVQPLKARNFAQKKLAQGYEVVQQVYAGSIHVRTRMPVWRLYATTSNNAEAHKIARQLRNKGFEARVIF